MRRESSKSLPDVENINAIFDFPFHPSVYYGKYKTREIINMSSQGDRRNQSEKTQKIKNYNT